MIEFNYEVHEGHIKRVADALAHDVCGLTPEDIGEEAMELCGLLRAVMREMETEVPGYPYIVLALVNDTLWHYAEEWAKMAFQLVDDDDSRDICICAKRKKTLDYRERVRAEVAEWRRQLAERVRAEAAGGRPEFAS